MQEFVESLKSKVRVEMATFCAQQEERAEHGIQAARASAAAHADDRLSEALQLMKACDSARRAAEKELALLKSGRQPDSLEKGDASLESCEDIESAMQERMGALQAAVSALAQRLELAQNAAAANIHVIQLELHEARTEGATSLQDICTQAQQAIDRFTTAPSPFDSALLDPAGVVLPEPEPELSTPCARTPVGGQINISTPHNTGAVEEIERSMLRSAIGLERVSSISVPTEQLHEASPRMVRRNSFLHTIFKVVDDSSDKDMLPPPPASPRPDDTGAETHTQAVDTRHSLNAMNRASSVSTVFISLDDDDSETPEGDRQSGVDETQKEDVSSDTVQGETEDEARPQRFELENNQRKQSSPPCSPVPGNGLPFSSEGDMTALGERCSLEYENMLLQMQLRWASLRDKDVRLEAVQLQAINSADSSESRWWTGSRLRLIDRVLRRQSIKQHLRCWQTWVFATLEAKHAARRLLDAAAEHFSQGVPAAAQQAHLVCQRIPSLCDLRRFSVP